MQRICVVAVVLALGLGALADEPSLVGEAAPELQAASWIRAPEGESLADLKGYVVLLLLPGTVDAGDPVSAAPFQDLEAAYGAEGLRVVALLEKAPDGDPEAISLATAVGPASGYGTTPRAVLVAADGKVTWSGEPRDITDETIAKHLKKAKAFTLRSVAPEAKPAATAFKKGKLSEARILAGAVDHEDAAYVAARVAALLACWQRRAEGAEALGDPATAVHWLEQIARRFKDAEEATAAAAKAKELKSDKVVKNEIKAADQYARLRVELSRTRGSEKKIAAVVKKAERLVEKYAGTKGAERAQRLVDSMKADPAIEAIQAFIAAKGINTGSGTWRTNLPKPPKVAFASGKTYYWNLQTNHGAIKVKFMPVVAPMHVSSTIYLTELGFYDGLTFHRVIPGFMAQGGCPSGTGTGSPGYKYAGEFSSNVRHDRGGLLSMANSGPGTDGSQFFLTFKPASHLDGKHTIFGEIVEGMDTMKELEKRGTQGGSTTEKLRIEKATITVE